VPGWSGRAARRPADPPLGVHLSGLFHFGILLGEKRVHLHSKPSGYLGTFLVGLAFAAGWTPCIGPILASILMMAATSGRPGKPLAVDRLLRRPGPAVPRLRYAVSPVPYLLQALPQAYPAHRDHYRRPAHGRRHPVALRQTRLVDHAALPVAPGSRVDSLLQTSPARRQRALARRTK